MERINPREVAEAAGLSGKGADQFARAWETGAYHPVPSIELERPVYVALQREVERAVVKALAGEMGDLNHPYAIYRTPGIPSPIVDPSHPRHDSFNAMFHREGGPLALIGVSAEHVHRQLEDPEVSRAVRGFANGLPKEVLNVRQQTPIYPPHMVIRPVGGMSFLAMHADQAPSKEVGTVMTELAQRWFDIDLRGHRCAMEKNRPESFLQLS